MRELTRNASHRDLQVYDPNSNDHNWGMNYVWVLGLIRRGVNVVFASPVVERYMIRAKPPLHLAGPHPSAFAMEMVLVLMAGYSLNYDALTDQITLKARPHSVELMRSLDGMPMSPTHQIEIYQRVARAIRDSAAKGLSIENWILPEVLYRMNAQQLEAEAHLGAYNDFGIASSPHATSELLASIASRTPAAGPVIAANPNTNAQVLAAIVAAGAAYDEIVASYRNIAATELAVIAGRTPAAWKAVAANANTAPHTLNAIVAAGSEHDVIVASNRNTAAEQLTIIARRSPAAHKAIAENFNADIQALSFVLKASAAHDMALVHHPHLTVLQLNTIAERTPAARVAAALHPNIRGGKHWMRQ